MCVRVCVTWYSHGCDIQLRLISYALFQAGPPTFSLHQIQSGSRAHSTSHLTSTHFRRRLNDWKVKQPINLHLMPGVTDVGISVIRIYKDRHWWRKKGNETLYCSLLQSKVHMSHKFLTRGRDHEHAEHVIQLIQIRIIQLLSLKKKPKPNGYLRDFMLLRCKWDLYSSWMLLSIDL